MSTPDLDGVLAELKFYPDCDVPLHDAQTVKPEARWVMYAEPCCGNEIWLICDHCLFALVRGGMAADGHDHPAGRFPGRDLKALGT